MSYYFKAVLTGKNFDEAIVDPVAAMSSVNQNELAALAEEVRQRLKRVAGSLQVL
ncbi:MAG: hypothetical protein U0V49_00885 [Saprospiraceae bacterium]